MTGAARQFALPLAPAGDGPARIVLGNANAAAAEALATPGNWPFGTAILTGPPRSGKSLLARWFAATGAGEAIDDAHRIEETALFHRWNRAQAEGARLLLVAGEPPWRIALPDLASRLAAALWLDLGDPDEAMAAALVESLAQARGLALGDEAVRYLTARAPRDAATLERLVLAIDRLSLERKVAPGLSVWRAALEEVVGPEEPRLL